MIGPQKPIRRRWPWFESTGVCGEEECGGGAPNPKLEGGLIRLVVDDRGSRRRCRRRARRVGCCVAVGRIAARVFSPRCRIRPLSSARDWTRHPRHIDKATLGLHLGARQKTCVRGHVKQGRGGGARQEERVPTDRDCRVARERGRK